MMTGRNSATASTTASEGGHTATTTRVLSLNTTTKKVKIQTRAASASKGKKSAAGGEEVDLSDEEDEEGNEAGQSRVVDELDDGWRARHGGDVGGMDKSPVDDDKDKENDPAAARRPYLNVTLPASDRPTWRPKAELPLMDDVDVETEVQAPRSAAERVVPGAAVSPVHKVNGTGSAGGGGGGGSGKGKGKKGKGKV